MATTYKILSSAPIIHDQAVVFVHNNVLHPTKKNYSIIYGLWNDFFSFFTIFMVVNCYRGNRHYCPFPLTHSHYTSAIHHNVCNLPRETFSPESGGSQNTNRLSKVIATHGSTKLFT